MASLGNISENPHIGMMFVDFLRDTVGLHVNGKAAVLENDELLKRTDLPASVMEDMDRKRRKPERWVVVEVEEAYMHCSKHIPHYQKASKTMHWGTDDAKVKRATIFWPRPRKNKLHAANPFSDYTMDIHCNAEIATSPMPWARDSIHSLPDAEKHGRRFRQKES